MDPWWLNRRVLRLDSIVLTDWKEAKGYLPPCIPGNVRNALPIAIDPAHVAERLRAQRSRFTAHGRDPRGLHTAAKSKGARLTCIRIASKAVDAMRLDLATCGIGDTTIFPDLEGLSRELSRYYNAKC